MQGSAHDHVANAETTLQQQIRLALGTHPDARLFRNQVGSLPDPRTGRLVTFGLARGSADLIGWRTVTITPDMVGQQLAVFTSIEVKTPTGRLAPLQANWLDTVQNAGGIAGVARSVEDAKQIIKGCDCSPDNFKLNYLLCKDL
jgi:hypothetical protein